MTDFDHAAIDEILHSRVRLAIAAFLGPQEKESFAVALSAALGEAKRGPTRTTFG